MSTQDKLADALREMTSFAHHMKHPPFGTIANADAALEAHDSDAAGGKGVSEFRLMREAFTIAVSDGLEKRYELVFKFRTLSDLQDAHREWIAAAPSPQEPK